MTPEQQIVKEAGLRLYHLLDGQGVHLTGVGIGLNKSGTTQAIHIRVLRKKDLKLVPKEFEGHEVISVVTGALRAL